MNLNHVKSIQSYDYLQYIEEKKLSIVRDIIRDCILFEKSVLENKKNIESPKLYRHLAIEIASNNVENLLFNSKIVSSLLICEKKGSKLIYPLKHAWIDRFESYGVATNRKLCLILYKIYILKSFSNRYLKAARTLTYFNPKKHFIGEDKLLVRIPNLIVEAHKNDLNLYTFVNWIIKQNLTIHEDNILFLTSYKGPFSTSKLNSKDIFDFHFIHSFKKLFKFFIAEPILFLKSFLISPDLILNYVNINEYLFKKIKTILVPSSESWIKSTWHLRAEEIGIKVIYVNLSDSSEPSFSFDNKWPVSWIPLSTWPNIFVCSDFQQDNFIDNLPIFSKAKLDLIGVPDWLDASASLSSFENFISIFDYEPHRGHYGFSCNNDSGYSNIDNTTRFLSEVVNIATSLGLKCILKPKRKISPNKRFGEYEDSIQRLSRSVDGFFVIDESISARKVIEKSKATIHMPFTSTGLIAKNLGVPACFYDPVGLIDPNDPASNKIQVLNSPENFRMWLMKLL